MDGQMNSVARCRWLVAVCWFGALPINAGPANAPTISIRLFEIFHPQSLEISGAATPSVYHAANGFHQTKKNPLLIFSANDTFLPNSSEWIRIDRTAAAIQIAGNGFNHSLKLTDTINVAAAAPTLSVKSGNKLFKRSYSGKLKIFAIGRELCIVNFVSSEDYLAGILAAEMPNADWAALQAQAVVARTFMIKNAPRHASNGYRFCDLTHCQTYKGSDGITAKIQQAIASTKDEILTFNHQPIDAYYSSTCGGTTADDAGIWAESTDRPYLKIIVDSTNCAVSPHFRWQARLSAARLHQIWQHHFGEPISSMAVTKQGNDGRVRELAIVGHSLHLINGEDFRTVMGRESGWNTIKSTAFNFAVDKNDYIFSGRGLGHGLGLCQYGAMAMARKEYSYQRILGHYFPGTEIKK